MIDVTAKVLGVIHFKRFQSEEFSALALIKVFLRPSRGCADQMHNLRRTFEQLRSFQEATVMCFVDFASPFHSMDSDFLWQIMAADGKPS